jgi:tight adherence protein B
MSFIEALLRSTSPLPLTIMAFLVAACAGVLLSVVLVLASERHRRDAARLNRATAIHRPAANKQAPQARIRRQDASRSSIQALNAILHRVLPDVHKFRNTLRQAGRRVTMDKYLLASILLAIAVAAAVTLLTHWALVLAVLIGLVLGTLLPYWSVNWLARRRRNRFIANFPDAIDIIVRAVRSGQPVSEAMKVVADQALPPVNEEFAEITDAVRVGMTLDEAIAQAADRINLTEFRFFHTALTIQQDTGGNLSETLSNLGKMLRRRRQIKLKIKAASAEARASAWIVGSLPVLMFFIIQLLNHPYAMTLIDDPRGLTMLAVAFASTCTGIAIMVKMANFDY